MEWTFVDGLLFGGVGGAIVGIIIMAFMFYPRDTDYY